MTDYSQCLSIVLLPTAEQQFGVEDPHCTLVYAGEAPEVHPSVPAGLALITGQLARVTQPFDAQVIGTEMFGDERDTPVLLLDSPVLHDLRSLVAQYCESEYTVYRPHVAVSAVPYPDETPASVRFTRIAAWLGDNHLSWRLGTGRRTAA